MLFDKVAFTTSLGSKDWLLMLIKQLVGARQLMPDPDEARRDTASFANDPMASNESVPP